jgi:pre-mRNA-splicing factor SYF2
VSWYDAERKKEERLKKLRDLHNKRNEARKLNHVEVQEEERRSNLPKNFESRKRRAEYLLDEEKTREECKESGEDYNRVKLLNVQADELERLNRLKQRKRNPDHGFSTYEDATIRQHKRLTQAIKVDVNSYEEEKKTVGEEAFYAGRDTLIHGLHKDKEDNIDKMVNDLEKTISKREKFSRRRMHNDEADIDYINERNMKFNKKLERFYGQYTSDIKHNLERGTAI